MLRIFLLIIAMLVLSNIHAGKDKKETYQVHINMPDHSIRTNVIAVPVKEKPDIGRTYYWYASNRIMGTMGGYDGKLLHGDYTSFYLNNSLREKGTLKKGLKHGKWISWHENGKIKEITNWRNGKREGSYYSFSELGLPVLEARFSNDVLHGKVISYESGKVVSRKKYRNGEEVVKKPRKLKTKRIKPAPVNEMPTKEGINTVTPDEKESKSTVKQRLRSLLPKKGAAVEKKENEEKPRKKKKAISEKKEKTKKPRSKNKRVQENK